MMYPKVEDSTWLNQNNKLFKEATHKVISFRNKEFMRTTFN